MAVSEEYLSKVRRAVRRADNPEINEELKDIIEECRKDLQLVGLIKSKTEDENDFVILGAVRCYVRWKFGVNNNEAEVNRDDYMQIRDELRKRREYCTSATEQD